MAAMKTHTQLAPLGPAARLLRVPAKWLRGEAQAGRIPHLKADGAFLFDVALVQRILLRRARAPKGQAHA
jgi:hypothetical protein